MVGGMKELAKFCPNCGNKNKNTSKYCEDCGIALGDVANISWVDKRPISFERIIRRWDNQSNNAKYGIGILGFFCVFVLGSILIFGIGELASADKSTQPTWHSVANFTGKGNKDTAPFEIKGDTFKLAVTATTESMGYGAFYVYVYPEGKIAPYTTQASIDSFSNYTESDEIYSYVGSGSYYCKISENNLDNWTVEVFDYY